MLLSWLGRFVGRPSFCFVHSVVLPTLILGRRWFVVVTWWWRGWCLSLGLSGGCSVVIAHCGTCRCRGCRWFVVDDDGVVAVFCVAVVVVGTGQQRARTRQLPSAVLSPSAFNRTAEISLRLTIGRLSSAASVVKNSSGVDPVLAMELFVEASAIPQRT